MRVELEQTLPGTAIISPRTLLLDGQGGETWSYAAGGTFPARLSPESSLRQAEAVAAGRVAEMSSWMLTLPAGTLITETDQVLYDGVTYEVNEVMTRVPWELSRRCRLTELD
jgi:hypothetical protein